MFHCEIIVKKHKKNTKFRLDFIKTNCVLIFKYVSIKVCYYLNIILINYRYYINILDIIIINSIKIVPRIC